MRLPKPKSPPGIFLWGLTTLALIILGRIVWVLVGQNVETVSTERGYDKLLSRHWSEIMDWLATNLFWLSLSAAALLGGVLCLWAYVLLQSPAADAPTAVEPQIDLEQLAQRAENLAAKVAVLAGEQEAARSVAWQTAMGQQGNGHKTMAEAEAVYTERYAARHLAETTQIIAEAEKAGFADRHMMFQLNTSRFRLGEVVDTLTRLAANLRHGTDDMPTREAFELQKRIISDLHVRNQELEQKAKAIQSKGGLQ